jgi:uncharacterized membrane protein
MENSIDLKALWQQQAVPKADNHSLQSKIETLRKRKTRQLVWSYVSLIGVALFISWVWYYYQPQFLSTKVGIVIIIASIFMLLVAVGKLGPFYKALDASVDSQHYLDALIQIRQREQVLYTRIMSLYFLFLSIGLGLYLYEYTSQMKPQVAATAYAITFAWMAFNWFYLRPLQIRKNAKKLDAVIRQAEEIKNQFVD